MPPPNPHPGSRRERSRRLVPVAIVTAAAIVAVFAVFAVFAVVSVRGTAPASRAIVRAPTETVPTSDFAVPVPPAPSSAAVTTHHHAAAPTTPTPPPAVTNAPAVVRSVKKGVAAAAYSWKAPAKLTALGVSWAYNWSASVPASTSSIQYVPMVWGPTSATPATLQKLTAGRESGKYRTLLTFNEPDKAKQADMTPAQAIAQWPALMATGLQLSSPAVASPTDGWLARFMALAAQHHYRVDFIALHFYVDFTNRNAVADLVATLRAVYARYQKPIWITELGALDTRPWGEAMAHLPSESYAVSYLKQVTQALDGLPFVARYAWFADNCWSLVHERTSSLYNGSGALTDLGMAYAHTS